MTTNISKESSTHEPGNDAYLVKYVMYRHSTSTMYDVNLL